MEKKITEAQFKDNRLIFEKKYKAAYAKLLSAFGVNKLENFDLNGKYIFSKLKYHEVMRLDNVMQNAGKNYNQKRFEIGIKFAKIFACQDVSEFSNTIEYAFDNTNEKIKACQKKNPNPVRPLNMKVEDIYLDQAYAEFMATNSTQFAVLKESFDLLQQQCDEENSKGDPKFGNKMAAANHYYKHNDFPTIDQHRPLSIEKYFEIARQMTSQDVTQENSKLTQMGDSLMITHKNPMNGAVAIRYDNLSDGKSVIATLYLNKKLIDMELVRLNIDD